MFEDGRELMKRTTCEICSLDMLSDTWVEGRIMWHVDPVTFHVKSGCYHIFEDGSGYVAMNTSYPYASVKSKTHTVLGDDPLYPNRRRAINAARMGICRKMKELSSTLEMLNSFNTIES